MKLWKGTMLGLVLAAPLSAEQAPLSSSAEPPPASNSMGADCEGCPEMMKIPAGEFVMGAMPGEEDFYHMPADWRGYSTPQHKVTIRKSFAMGKYEVTRDEYALFVKETQRPDPASCYIVDEEGDYVAEEGKNWRRVGIPQTGDGPAMCIAWEDAKAYTQWLAKKTGKPYRLPTEAEWEYAARAGTQTINYWGNEYDKQCAYVNAADNLSKAAYPSWNKITQADCDNGFLFASPVGSLKPNFFNLYDMIGNAHEWVEDCWRSNYVGASTDGSAALGGDCAKRTQRGGAWSSYTWRQRSAYRWGMAPDMRFAATGFRVALTLEN